MTPTGLHVLYSTGVLLLSLPYDTATRRFPFSFTADFNDQSGPASISPRRATKTSRTSRRFLSCHVLAWHTVVLPPDATLHIHIIDASHIDSSLLSIQLAPVSGIARRL
jgi:hypothetical protein